MITKYDEVANELPSLSTDDSNAVARMLAIAALPVATRFKNPAFFEEREWRITELDWRTDLSHLEFVSAGGMMRPYRVLVSGSRLPIRRVIAGASRSEGQAIRTARLMLDRFDYRDIDVVVSDVPLQI
jgi:hypothetical protein